MEALADGHSRPSARRVRPCRPGAARPQRAELLRAYAEISPCTSWRAVVTGLASPRTGSRRSTPATSTTSSPSPGSSRIWLQVADQLRHTFGLRARGHQPAARRAAPGQHLVRRDHEQAVLEVSRRAGREISAAIERGWPRMRSPARRPHIGVTAFIGLSTHRVFPGVFREEGRPRAVLEPAHVDPDRRHRRLRLRSTGRPRLPGRQATRSAAASPR